MKKKLKLLNYNIKRQEETIANRVNDIGIVILLPYYYSLIVKVIFTFLWLRIKDDLRLYSTQKLIYLQALYAYIHTFNIYTPHARIHTNIKCVYSFYDVC